MSVQFHNPLICKAKRQFTLILWMSCLNKVKIKLWSRRGISKVWNFSFASSSTSSSLWWCGGSLYNELLCWLRCILNNKYQPCTQSSSWTTFESLRIEFWNAFKNNYLHVVCVHLKFKCLINITNGECIDFFL